MRPPRALQRQEHTTSKPPSPRRTWHAARPSAWPLVLRRLRQPAQVHPRLLLPLRQARDPGRQVRALLRQPRHRQLQQLHLRLQLRHLLLQRRAAAAAAPWRPMLQHLRLQAVHAGAQRAGLGAGGRGDGQRGRQLLHLGA